ncbi:MAG: KpsF/GutQ family sugar-phosphate isomerase [Candidatus Zixiibacteriota bacterium]|nr:MAG: KpsF/GutQ family sugar-phosphate isomerase [candidate division Zixibacteria bacterium]
MTDLLEYAREVIRLESEAVAGLAERLDENFNRAVETILECEGRVIVTGMGKSGLIGKKIAATFNSTGISSFFLHPAEALHGDMGLMRPEDILMILSKSGQVSEIEPVIAAALRIGMKLIALCGTPHSPLWERAEIVLDCSVENEACPNNLVPTSSAAAALVMGDTLALALLKKRNFGPSDFAVLHPGGTIGRRLLKRVHELHHTGDRVPLVTPKTSFPELILEMTSKRLGCVFMTDEQGRPAGVFTDGDLRRLIQENEDVSRLAASDVMIRGPKTIPMDALLDAALAVMEKHSITQLATVDRDDKLVGIIHLHDILKSKLV